MSAALSATEQAQPLKYRCPHCKATPGSACRKVERFGVDIVLGTGHTRSPHGERIVLATRQARIEARARRRTGNHPFSGDRGY